MELCDTEGLRVCQSWKYRLKASNVPILTSAIVSRFNLGSSKVDRSHDGIHMVDLSGRGKTENILIEKTDHVLSADSVFGLPAYMKRSA
jgi:hypothetical protein